MVGVVRAAPSGARAAPPRAVVTWEGPGEPIVLTLYGADGEVVAAGRTWTDYRDACDAYLRANLEKADATISR